MWNFCQSATASPELGADGDDVVIWKLVVFNLTEHALRSSRRYHERKGAQCYDLNDDKGVPSSVPARIMNCSAAVPSHRR